jgi:hypothetical protein
MTWLDPQPEFERRPLVFVEDHLYHTAEILAAMAAERPDLIGLVTICGIDRAGPDTSARVHEWLEAHPRVQVAARVEARDRLLAVSPAETADAMAFARFVARLLRPGGILVQDIQLSTLPFLPADRWWESIYLAATVRGLFPDRQPAVRFLSNKRGYAATFGRELMEAGFDPRDVMDKSELAVVVPAIASMVDRAFPLALDGILPPSTRRGWAVGDHPQERREVESAFDLVLWPTPHGVELGGRAIAESRVDRRVSLRSHSHEGDTWRALIEARLAGGEGLSVLGVGERVGPEGAERAELSNLAARHIHALRSRLSDPSAVTTVNHTYRLRDATSVAICRTSGDLRAGPH